MTKQTNKQTNERTNEQIDKQTKRFLIRITSGRVYIELT